MNELRRTTVMQVVTSHSNLDFDGFASMIAYNKLNPEAKMVLPPNLNQNVKAFYSLYKDTFPFYERVDFDLNEISTLALVDTSDERRIGKFIDIIDKVDHIIIYDHHTNYEFSREPTRKVTDQLGATCTLLVEDIISNQLELTPLEATVIALGIYEDTGNLTYSSTTSRDIKALAFLLDCGADLNVISDYVFTAFTANQRNLFEELLTNMELSTINEYIIGIATAEREQYLQGAAVIVHKLMEIENVDAFFMIVKMGKKVYIIGRSRRDDIDIQSILKDFQGKGHKQAASATVKELTLSNTRNKLLDVLRLKLPVPVTAETIMSSPVKTITASTTVQKAEELLYKYGHNGLPVVSDPRENYEENRLVGIVSRRDIEKAKYHGFGHSPVKGYMSRKIITISPSASIKEIRHLIVNNKIGRLPVVDDQGELVGIVTRTDLLNYYHGLNTGEEEKRDLFLKEVDEFSEDINELMARRLPKKVMGILYLLGQKADKNNYKIYGVGGFVRDLFLGIENLDLDVVVEKDAIGFAKIAKRYFGGDLKVFPQFQTARLALPSGMKIDFATARLEFYAFPAASPDVEESTIKQDLFRRDFTINTLAVELNSSSFGKLLDFFNGRRDLKNAVIRVLYNLSFVEDPTRIFRAIRFETRLGFQIEEETVLFIKNSLSTGVLDKLPGEKLYEEFRNIINEPNFHQSFKRMDELGIFSAIFPDLKLDRQKFSILKNIEYILNWYYNRSQRDHFVSKEAMVFTALLMDQPKPIVSSLCERLKIPVKTREVIITSIDNVEKLADELSIEKKNSELAAALENFALETILFVLARKEDSKIKAKIYHYLENISGVGTSITGKDLRNLGINPGPHYKEALEEVKKARLDGLVSTPEEELDFVLEFFEKKGEKELG